MNGFIAPTVVLTAGHCVVDTVVSFVLLREKVIFGDLTGALRGTPYTHPEYDPGGQGNVVDVRPYRDVGIVVLDSPADVAPKAQLPSADLVDTLKTRRRIDIVGFGVWEQARVPGVFLPKPPPYYRWTGGLERMHSWSALVPFRHSADVIGVSMNAAQGKGGLCWGDSGGPNLLGQSDTVLAVTSYTTNYNCRGVGYSSRVDKPAVLEWIAGFMQP